MTVPTVKNISHKVEIEIVQQSTSDKEATLVGGDSSAAATTKSPNRVRMTLNNIQLSGDGKFYYIMEKTKIYYEDPDDPGYYTTKIIYDSKVPTPEQIYNCKNWKDRNTPICGRVVITNG